MPNVKKYPIIGGPLDGKYANTKDFQREYRSPSDPRFDQECGQYEEHRRDYTQYNAGGIHGGPSMVFLYVPTLPNIMRMPQEAT